MLETKKLRKTEFTKILRTYCAFTEEVSDINPYKNGYRNKNVIYYTSNTLICTESELKYLDLLEGDDYTDWKQVIIQLDNESTSKKVQADVTGTISKAIINKELYKAYSEEELDATLSYYNDEYDEGLKQVHIFTEHDIGELVIYDDCIGYDINGAHNDALREMLPKKADYFEKLYNERKEKPQNKCYVNYYVGIMKHQYEGAYQHIVHRTTKMLLEGIGKTDGFALYANTDGFIVKNSKYELEDSKELGKFKVEMRGKLYSYKDKNYWCIQYIDTKGKVVLKGNVLNEVREQINLFEGKVVHYDRFKNEFNHYEARNITTEIIKL